MAETEHTPSSGDRKRILWVPILLGVIAVSIYVGTLFYHVVT
jgi:hypothetical protein